MKIFWITAIFTLVTLASHASEHDEIIEMSPPLHCALQFSQNAYGDNSPQPGSLIKKTSIHKGDVISGRKNEQMTCFNYFVRTMDTIKFMGQIIIPPVYLGYFIYSHL